MRANARFQPVFQSAALWRFRLGIGAEAECDRRNELGSGRELLVVDALFDPRHKSWGVVFH